MAGRRLALIVATDEYLDPGLAKLRAAASDADALAGALADPEIGDFQVDVLRNGTSSAVAERVDSFLSESKADDLVVLHFSCHGIKDDSGELYLAATNTRPGLLPSTAVDASLVNRLMRRSRARRAVLFLDCCFGGAFERGLVPRSTGVIDVADQFRAREGELDGGRGRVVITSSNAMEFAFEGVDLANAAPSQPSIFTGALVEGLTTGAADRDQDGVVSLGELYEYVFERVRDATPNQTPGKWEFGLQGELVLAKNPQRIIVPAPLPADLAELVENPFPGTRLGTIDVLVRLANGTNLPVAAGARNVLEQMVNDDSRGVAAAAEEALSKTGIRLSGAEVDIGTVGLGAEAMAEVSLDGPPLVTASRVESSNPLLRVRRVDRTVRIEVDTSVPGPAEGTVSVSGPAGSASIHVVAVVGGIRLENVGETAVPSAPVMSAPSAPAGSPAMAPAAAAATSESPPPAPQVPAAPPEIHPTLAPTEGRSAMYARSARRLVERGWHTGHVQTIVGAEIGGIVVWTLNLNNLIGGYLFTWIDQVGKEVAATAIIWVGAVVGAGLLLRVSGPGRTVRTLIVLALLYPAFYGLARELISPDLIHLIQISLVIAVLALIAASVARLKRPQPA